MTNIYEVIVIGGGQSGLSVGYQLKQRGVPFLILDANERVGDVWRDRWDSLRLFSPARFDGLPGMPFPAAKTYFPTKDEMADFLTAYAKRFALPIETGVRVDRLRRSDSGFVVRAGTREIEARQVVVAMSNFQTPKLPSFASALDPRVLQMHSVEYRNPGQLREGSVLIVGAGNSGSEIAIELAKAGRRVSLAGKVPGVIPFRPQSFLGRQVLAPFTLGVVFHRVLKLDSPLGRKAAAAERGKATPLVRVKPKDLRKAGVVMLPKVAGVKGREVILENQKSCEPANVIWCTGFAPGFSWIHLPVFDEAGLPIHRRGVVEAEPGLYFTGLKYLYSMSSEQIQGTERDSAYVGDAIVRFMDQRSSKPGREIQRNDAMVHQGRRARALGG